MNQKQLFAIVVIHHEAEAHRASVFNVSDLSSNICG